MQCVLYGVRTLQLMGEEEEPLVGFFYDFGLSKFCSENLPGNDYPYFVTKEET